jgi:parallel beta-helix repeat protein
MKTNTSMKTSILFGTKKRLSRLILLTGLVAVASIGSALAKPPTPVTAGSIITAPGEYYLAGDCTGPGITILASNVHLMLNGHTMTGLRFNHSGVEVEGASNVHIEGPGTITNFFEGIQFGDDEGAQSSAVSNSHVEQVTCVNNTDAGIVLRASNNNHVNNSVFSGNGGGIGLILNSSDNHVDNNEADSNSFYGIAVAIGSTGNHINGNTALDNRFLDLLDENPNCDDNQWNGNEFDTANMPCID